MVLRGGGRRGGELAQSLVLVDLMRLNQDFSVIVNQPAIWEMEQGRKRAAEAKKAWKRGATISVRMLLVTGTMRW